MRNSMLLSEYAERSAVSLRSNMVKEPISSVRSVGEVKSEIAAVKCSGHSLLMFHSENHAPYNIAFDGISKLDFVVLNATLYRWTIQSQA